MFIQHFNKGLVMLSIKPIPVFLMESLVRTSTSTLCLVCAYKVT